MTAQEAKKESDLYFQLNPVFAQIKETTKLGKYKVYYSYLLSDDSKQFLIKLGYIVNEIYTIQRSEYGNDNILSHYEIGWQKL